MPTFGSAIRPEWPLDPDIVYLNHGTVGVTPRRVSAAQQAIRDDIERQPARFMLRELTAATFGGASIARPRMRTAAAAVAEFLGARGEDLVFVDNTTTGANAVLRSFPLEPGDEILVSDLGYGGVTNAARHAARARGATVRTVNLPYPVRASGQIVDAFENAVGPRTRLAIVDHITSASALILPLADIAARLHERGVAVLADGAHAPGAIPLDIPSLGADWYIANLHKWLWVPRSSGILWAGPERQRNLHPAVVSWGLDEGFTREFDAPGTRDPSPHLAAPAAIAFMRELGVDAVRAYNHSLAWNGARQLADRWDTPFETPESMIGCMATIALPEALGTTSAEAGALRDALLFEERIEAPVHAFRDRLYVRVCAQVYNESAEIERLGDSIAARVASAVQSVGPS